ncbi:MAG: universal stress protein, partial [Tepidiformaceae bacterium]
MKILVCTDGSPGSLAVLPHAGRFASAVGAEIVLTRVLDPRVDAASVVSPSLEAAVTTVQTSWEAGLREVLSAAGLSGSVMVPRRAWGKEVADAIHLAADETEA